MTRNLKKTTLWNLLFQYYSIFYSITLGLLLVPLYVAHIPINIYGAWLASGNLVLWLTSIDPGISEVLKIKVLEAYAKKEFNKLSDYLFSSLIILFFISLLIIFVGIILSFFLNFFLKELDRPTLSLLTNSFYLAITGTSLLIFSFGLSSFNQGMLSSLGIGLIYVFSTIISLAISIYLLKHNYGLVSIPIGQIICASLLIISNSIYLFYRFKNENIPLKFSIKSLKNIFFLCSANFVGKIGSIISNQIDALLISNFIGTASVPSYVLTKKGPELSRTFIERPPLALLPSISNLWHLKNYEKLNYYIIRLFKLLIWIMGIVFIGFVLCNKDFINLWVGSKFYVNPYTNILICLNLILLVTNSVFTNIYFTLGKINVTSNITFIQSIITAFLLFIGIKYWGINGMLISQIFSYLLFSTWILPLKVFNILNFSPNPFRNLMYEFLIVTLSCIITFFIYNNENLVDNWANFLLLILKIILTYFAVLSFLSSSLRLEIKIFLNHFSILK